MNKLLKLTSNGDTTSVIVTVLLRASLFNFTAERFLFSRPLLFSYVKITSVCLDELFSLHLSLFWDQSSPLSFLPCSPIFLALWLDGSIFSSNRFFYLFLSQIRGIRPEFTELIVHLSRKMGFSGGGKHLREISFLPGYPVQLPGKFFLLCVATKKSCRQVE